jgi:predicted O-methyltransferase YrrM
MPKTAKSTQSRSKNRKQKKGSSPEHVIELVVDAPASDAAEAPGTFRPLAEARGKLTRQLLDELWHGESPFLFADLRQKDNGYPNTNIQPDLIDAVLTTRSPVFWLEVGTMIGGSAIAVADAIKRLGLQTSICCVDPFTGDVNMWDWEKGKKASGEWSYLKLEAGRPTIYERFLANVRLQVHEDIIAPLPATAMVGMRLIERLVAQGRLAQLPEVIYHDAAHEPGETLLELQTAWSILQPGGILFGDDWAWPSVRGDVQTFARSIVADTGRMVDFLRRFEESQLEGNVFLYRGQWVVFKPAAE